MSALLKLMRVVGAALMARPPIPCCTCCGMHWASFR